MGNVEQALEAIESDLGCVSTPVAAQALGFLTVTAFYMWLSRHKEGMPEARYRSVKTIRQKERVFTVEDLERIRTLIYSSRSRLIDSANDQGTRALLKIAREPDYQPKATYIETAPKPKKKYYVPVLVDKRTLRAMRRRAALRERWNIQIRNAPVQSPIEQPAKRAKHVSWSLPRAVRYQMHATRRFWKFHGGASQASQSVQPAPAEQEQKPK